MLVNVSIKTLSLRKSNLRISEFKICVTVEWSMPFLSINPTEMSAYVPQDIHSRMCTKSLFFVTVKHWQ